MRKQFILLAGHFSRSLEKHTLLSFMLMTCSGLQVIELYENVQGEAKKAYSCKLTFDSKASMQRAAKILRKRKFRGHSLDVRVWAERTAANERRNVHWRFAANLNGKDRRIKDRRRYQEPITLFERH